MTVPRYVVHELPWGAGVAPWRRDMQMRYAVVDDKPDQRSVWDAAHQERKLEPWGGAPLYHWRQIAFCYHKEDADRIAEILNRECRT